MRKVVRRQIISNTEATGYMTGLAKGEAELLHQLRESGVWEGDQVFNEVLQMAEEG